MSICIPIFSQHSSLNQRYSNPVTIKILLPLVLLLLPLPPLLKLP
jgi:hypothetical protein